MQLSNVKAVESLNVFEKCFYFMSLNAMKCDCGSIFLRYLIALNLLPKNDKVMREVLGVDTIHKYGIENIANWGTLYMSSKQTCIHV